MVNLTRSPCIASKNLKLHSLQKNNGLNARKVILFKKGTFVLFTERVDNLTIRMQKRLVQNQNLKKKYFVTMRLYLLFYKMSNML